MEPRRVATTLAVVRTLLGVAMFAVPRLVGRVWLARAPSPGTQLALRVAGVRDVALGLGTLAGLSEGREVRRWLEAGALADAGDATAALVARDELPAVTVAATAVPAATAAAVGLWARFNLEGVEGELGLP